MAALYESHNVYQFRGSPENIGNEGLASRLLVNCRAVLVI